MDRPKKIAWSRGLLRLWFALSAVWIVGVLGYSVYAASESVDRSASVSRYDVAASIVFLERNCAQNTYDYCASAETIRRAAEIDAEKRRVNYSSIWNILTQDTFVRTDMVSMLSAPFFVLIIGAVAVFGIKIIIMLGGWILRGFRAAD